MGAYTYCGSPLPRGCQITTPLVYDESLSYQQQLACLRGMLENCVTQEDARLIYERLEKLEYSMNENWVEHDDIREDIMRLKERIEKLVIGQVTSYDPTHGQSRRDLDTVVRRVYEFDRYFGITAHDYDGLKLTAARYDALGIDAYDFDVCGAMMLYDEREVQIA